MTAVSSPSYHLALTSRSEHLFTVTLHIPACEQQRTVLTLPAWIPGSYMVRDFARNIISLQARAGNNALTVTKQDKQTWSFSAPGQAVTVTYTIFAFDLSVRSAYINDEFAFCNGTSVFLQVSGFEQQPHQVTIENPGLDNWITETTMPVSGSSYQCANYAELIDHPVFMGKAHTQSFVVDGVEFVMLLSGEAPVDIDRICEDLVPICQHHLDLFEKPYPVERYVFMTMLAENGFGGLEHRSSTALLYPRMDLPLPGDSKTRTDGYTTFLSLCSHELFHTWHVKRIKPDVMVNPDMGAEVFTNQLWIYEGFTSFYDDLTLARAGTITNQKYLEIVGQNLTRLMQNEGRKLQGAAESSFDAWTRFYKQDANSVNHIVSYYTKGGIIAMGLDLLLRRESGEQYNLDHLMRLLWQHYGKDESGTPDDVIHHLCQTHFDIDVSAYLEKVVYGTDDVDLTGWLDDIGVALHTRTKRNMADKGGTAPVSQPKHAFGANTKAATPGLSVLQVISGTPAQRAGLQIGDILLAIDGLIASESHFQRLLDAQDPARGTVPVSVIRDGRLLTLSMPVEPAVQDACYFTITDEKKFNSWLGKAE
ncbi:M61 family metallopeptidase [Salinimonas lutimaris]|uniref:M61 family metallopeptidase n=1 Tax=Salinimonas lutimaris TaxID=914153 RepID=UPI0010C10485|nr:PDZ domain-containing protein [Salinimonas lutimaris]